MNDVTSAWRGGATQAIEMTSSQRSSSRAVDAVLSPSRVEVLLETLISEVRMLSDDVQSLRAGVLSGRGPRDEADASVLLVIREAIADRDFTSAQLVEHATVDERLGAALLAADLVDGHDVGMFLRRLQGITVNGLRVERVGECRDGALWCVRL